MYDFLLNINLLERANAHLLPKTSKPCQLRSELVT